jgi:hypothetical protein
MELYDFPLKKADALSPYVVWIEQLAVTMAKYYNFH